MRRYTYVVFVHSTNRINKFQTWFLVIAIAIVVGLNLAMTSYLTTQSLSEKPIEVALDQLAPAEIEDFADTSNVESTMEDIAEDRYSIAPVAVRQPAPRPEPRFVARALPPAERIVTVNTAELFKPRIIRIPKSEPIVLKSAPVAPQAQPVYLTKIDDRSPAMTARVVTRKRDTLIVRIVKKPWQLIKAVASKFN
jgi:hypothetical protein